jgi:hypothetical protein
MYYLFVNRPFIGSEFQSLILPITLRRPTVQIEGLNSYKTAGILPKSFIGIFFR